MVVHCLNSGLGAGQDCVNSLILFEKKWHWPGQTESQELLTISLKFGSTLIGYQHRLDNNIFIIIQSMDITPLNVCNQVSVHYKS